MLSCLISKSITFVICNSKAESQEGLQRRTEVTGEAELHIYIMFKTLCTFFHTFMKTQSARVGLDPDLVAADLLKGFRCTQHPWSPRLARFIAVVSNCHHFIDLNGMSK